MPSKGTQNVRIARAAARYRPGKAPLHVAEDYSSDENEEAGGSANDGDHVTTAAQHRLTAGVLIQSGDGPIQSKSVKLRLNESGTAEEEQDGRSSEYETDSDAEVIPALKPVFRRPATGAAAPTVTVANSKQSSSEYETDSEDGQGDGSSEEDDRPALLKPIFVPKGQRTQVDPAVRQGAAQQQLDEEAAERKATEEAQHRRKESHAMAAAQIRQELDAKEHDEAQPDLSDTDGKDAEAEFVAWRIRELSRIRRDREDEARKEAERDEIERRRAMPEVQRLAEDTKRARASRVNKAKGAQGFLQTYYHKGSFFQDMDIVNQRDYTAPTESAVDKSLLPSMMQVRDYGKKSRSKWTHLANEDTSSRNTHPPTNNANGAEPGGSRRGCFVCGGPHVQRDCPERLR